MSLAKASLWTASSTLLKIAIGLLVVKLLAVKFGPEGVGLAGNYRQLITVLAVLSGAGIFNGVTKLVAQNQQNGQVLRQTLGVASTLVLLSATLIALLLFFAAKPISALLFESQQYATVIQAVAFIQFGIACANLFLAVIKGFRDARGNAFVVITGSVLGVIVFYVAVQLGGYQGALIGLALVPALLALPALCWLWRSKTTKLRDWRPVWQSTLASHLGRFTLMALMTAITLPVAYVMMRNLLATHQGWQAVGMWQGVSTISDAYLQFITASFSVYLLPTLARLEHKQAISSEIVRTLRFVMPTVAIISFIVWLLRDVAISLLFSAQFAPMRSLFAWQLVGDVFKIGAYVFGYLVIARASLRFYALTEISQFILLTLLSHLLIPMYGAVGATAAYMITYLLYFTLCCAVFVGYHRRK